MLLRQKLSYIEPTKTHHELANGMRCRSTRFQTTTPPLHSLVHERMSGDQPGGTASHPSSSAEVPPASLTSATDSHPPISDSYDYPHLSVITFSDVFRQMDRASSPTPRAESAPTSKKRRLIDDGTSTSAALQQRLNHLTKKKKQKSEQETIIAPLTSGSTISSSAEAYSPFSKSKLLERVATYQLASYKVRLPSVAALVKSFRPFASREEEIKTSQAVEALARWVEPIGPALFGWTHLQPLQTLMPRHAPHDAIQGAKNKLVCRVCDSHWDVALSSDDDGEPALKGLVETVRGLHYQHKEWCAWRRRRCDARLYRLTGSSAAGSDAISVTLPFVGNLGTKKAQQTFAESVQKVEKALVDVDVQTEVRIQRPKSLTEEQLGRLSEALSLPDTYRHRHPAILLTLFGWATLTTSTATQSSTASSIIFSCGYCSRKINIPLRSTSTKSRSINPEFEHRSFCPWVQAETQGNAKYLWDLTADDILFQSDAADEEERESRQRILMMLQTWHEANISQGSDSASVKRSLAGWQASLAALLPSPVANETDDGSQDSMTTSTSYRDLRPSQAVKLLNGWFGGGTT